LINHFFTVFDIGSALFILLLIVVHSFWMRHQHPLETHYRYFLPSVYFKLFFALGFSLFYIIYYNAGGDTIAYWDGATRLTDLFYESPADYFSELFTAGGASSITDHFTKNIGYPPIWIYNEPESWLVCKLLSLFMIIGFKGYLAITFFLAYLSHLAAWKLFELVLSYNIHRERLLAIAVLFIPSVSFWCSGISKDTMLYIALMLFITYFFRKLKGGSNRNYIGIVLYGLLLLGIRPVMFMAAAAPVLFALIANILRKQIESPELRIIPQIMAIVSVMFVSLFILTNGSIIDSAALNNMITEAAIVQQDFTNNTTYGENRYFLEITDYTVLGMTKVLPAAVIAGIYRPFLWESLTPSLILNGIESMFLLWFSIRFFLGKKLKERLHFIRRHELLVYLFFVMIFIAFFSGFTSVIFGVLVRIRSFALPFLLIILFADSSAEKGDRK